VDFDLIHWGKSFKALELIPIYIYMAVMDETTIGMSVFSFRIIISAEPFTEHTYTHTICGMTVAVILN
jgi:hypothetical protein